ncbi:MAG: oligosaccharide flippase family protein [Lachnospiraceae bacterium]|nr:oligosaccharide flippase family protein [Lachnospiraceae bacterium]
MKQKESPQNQYRRLALDILIFIIGTVLAKAIQFILLPLYTSFMTTQAYGVAELINNLSELFFPIATLCIYEAAFRYVVDSEFEDGRIIVAVIKVMTSSLCIGFIITLACKTLFHYKYAFYLFFILYAYSIRMCMAYYVRGMGLSKVFAMSGVVNAFSLGVFSIILLVILKTTIKGYLISIGLSYCVSTLYLLIRGRVVKDINIHVKSKSDLKILFCYCIPLVFYNVLYWFTTIAGRYILLWFTDSSTAGRYVAAIKIAAVINMVQQAVYAAFQLNSSRMYMEKEKEVYYSDIINLFISIYCTFGAFIVCLTPVLAKIALKNDFYSAKCYLPAIMFAALVNCISSLLGTMYSTYKKTQKLIGVSIVGAIVNVGVGLILTPLFGIWGICIASSCCYTCQAIYKFIDIARFCTINYNWKLIISDILILLIIVLMMSISIPNKIGISLCFATILLIINQKYIVHTLRMIRNK